MIDAEDINIALQTAKPLFNELQNQYENLPPTRCRCQKPGVCCAYLPQMTLMEALQWVDILRPVVSDDELIAILEEIYQLDQNLPEQQKKSKRRTIRTSVFG